MGDVGDVDASIGLRFVAGTEETAEVALFIDGSISTSRSGGIA